MVVTLKVVSYQKNVLGADAQVQFDPKGGSFGRSEDNDWVLPDPERIISSRHGIVDFRDGEFWITDCSTNGIYIGDRSVLLGKGKSVMLHHGDHLILGEYEVEVDVHSARLQSNEIPTGARTPDLVRDDLINEPQFDPLLALGGGAGNPPGGSGSVNIQRNSDHAPGAMSNHSSPLHDPFEIPDQRRSGGIHAPVGTAEPIPEDWNMTGFFASAVNEETSTDIAAAGEDPFYHTADDTTDTPNLKTGHVRASSVAIDTSPAASVQIERRIPDHDKAADRIRGEPERLTPSDSASTSVDSGAVPRTSAPAGDEGDLIRTFLRAAGLNDALFDSIDASVAMSECGHLFGDLLQGMMELLRARSEMKNEFRMSLTTVRSSENNPLKFTINASEVLRILLVDKPSGYLGAEASVAEGVDDLRNHQIAMIAGMQAAFDSLVQRLDPNRFSNTNEQKSWLQSVLPIADKAAAWDNYRRFHASTAGSDRAFQKVFGDVFAQAYEEQSRRLRFEAGK